MRNRKNWKGWQKENQGFFSFLDAERKEATPGLCVYANYPRKGACCDIPSFHIVAAADVARLNIGRLTSAS